jgi:aquaporin NIP
MFRKYIAEFIGTFALVFFGTGAIIVNQQMNGVIGHTGIAAVFGLVIMIMIYAFGNISGAHFNPAVTTGFAIAGKFAPSQLAPYIISQVAGAFTATLILKVLFPSNEMLGTTMPAGSDMQSFLLEALLTFFLMLVILRMSFGAKEMGVMAAMAIGGTILIDAMFGGPVSGASMNPARSLAPAVITGHLSALYIYIIAPVLGSALAVLVFKVLETPEEK